MTTKKQCFYLALFLNSLNISIFLSSKSFSFGVNVSVSSTILFIKCVFEAFVFKSSNTKLSIETSRTFAIFTRVSSEGIPLALSICPIKVVETSNFSANCSRVYFLGFFVFLFVFQVIHSSKH